MSYGWLGWIACLLRSGHIWLGETRTLERDYGYLVCHRIWSTCLRCGARHGTRPRASEWDPALIDEHE